MRFLSRKCYFITKIEQKMHLVLNKNEFLLLEDFPDYNRFPKFQPIDDRLHVNERFSIIIDHRNNTNYLFIFQTKGGKSD